MHGRLKFAIAVAVVVGATVAVSAALATNGGKGGGGRFSAQLSGFQEDPLTLSTTGTGQFRAQLRAKDGEIRYTLSYANLEAPVTQAHIHLGQRAQSGGISVFLCSNLGNGPMGTQACPPAPATISGTIRATDVIGPAGQGIDPGQLNELITAIRAGVTYANVHSTKYPGGEIRAQLERGKGFGRKDK
jgi:CHRD domain